MTATSPKAQADMRGWLYKWTNYLKGYQKRWFVLSNGVLCYYRNQAEMAHTCRGTINLHRAVIHSEDSTNFVVSNGGAQAFHIKAANSIEKQRWVTALQLAKANAIKDDVNEVDSGIDYIKAELSLEGESSKSLVAKLDALKTCNEQIMAHGATLQKALTDLETVESTEDAMRKVQSVNEGSALFRLTANSMINKCNDFLLAAQKSSKKWRRMLDYEREQRERLHEMLEQLARQHHILEQAASSHRSLHQNDIVLKRKAVIPPFDSKYEMLSDDDSFYDAQTDEEGKDEVELRDDTLVIEDNGKSIIIEETPTCRVHLSSCGSTSCSSSIYNRPSGTLCQQSEVKERRSRVPEKPNQPANLWSIVKNCIGKDLSKIPMPVNFSEPLSMLQRLVEDFEYSDILDYAATLDDPDKQLAYVAAFTISCYSTTAFRTGKPFNPLLGETYEYDRRKDHGWRIISEQVSHHPPMAALHCEGKSWTCWQEVTMASKFRGSYLQIVPIGTSHLVFNDSGYHITWTKVTTVVNNIIIGKLWIDQTGDANIINHNTGSKCHLNYVEHSMFSSKDSKRKVKGCVLDKDGKALWAVTGNWDTSVEIAPIISSNSPKDNRVLNKTGDYEKIWEINPLPHNSEKYYSFSVFASQLNEMEDGVAPTDSRLRPDQRLMEEGRWDEANVLKIQLEEKQRTVRKQRQKEYLEMLELESQLDRISELPNADNESCAGPSSEHGKSVLPPYEPIWFKKEVDPTTNELCHVYKGGYWECKKKKDWSMCPNIF